MKQNSSNLFVEGEVHKRPMLANTLKILAKDGSDSFYKGALGRQIIAELQRLLEF